jgi:hypothetical protein
MTAFGKTLLLDASRPFILILQLVRTLVIGIGTAQGPWSPVAGSVAHAQKGFNWSRTHLSNQGFVPGHSFVSEHIETLEEIDMEYRQLALASGVVHWGRVPALGVDPTFIDDLADAVLEALPFVGAMAMSSVDAKQVRTQAAIYPKLHLLCSGGICSAPGSSGLSVPGCSCLFRTVIFTNQPSAFLSLFQSLFFDGCTVNVFNGPRMFLLNSIGDIYPVQLT